jgi:hypothetical protein
MRADRLGDRLGDSLADSLTELSAKFREGQENKRPERVELG